MKSKPRVSRSPIPPARGDLFSSFPVLSFNQFLHQNFGRDHVIKAGVAAFVFLKERPRHGIRGLQFLARVRTFLADQHE